MASTRWSHSGTPQDSVMHLTHVTVGWAQLRSFWISQAPHGLTLRIYPYSSSSTRWPPQPDGDEDEAEHPTEPVSRRLEKAFTMRAGWMQALPGAPQATPRGQFWGSHTHTLVGPCYITPIIWSSFLGFMQTAIFPRLAHSRNCGHVFSSQTEVHRWKSATPRQPTWSNDALNSRRFLGNNMPDTLARMSADTMECDEARVHLEQLDSSIRERSHLVNVAAHQVEPTDRPHARGHFNHDHPQARNANDCSWRPPTRSLRPTTTSTASPAKPVSRKNASTPGYNGDPARQRSTHPLPIAIGRSALHESHTLTFLDDRRTWLCTACGHVARLRTLKLAQPCPRVLSTVGRRNMAAIQNAANWIGDPSSPQDWWPCNVTLCSGRSPLLPSCSSSDASVAGDDNMRLPLFEMVYHHKMGPILLPLCG